MPYPGEVLSGLYQVVDEIGKGGAGIIYRAYHLNLHKYVVVKKIKDNFVGVLDARGEVDILKSLHHTCLPQVYDFLQIGNNIYTVMDYIEGHDFKYYIDGGYQFEEGSLWFWLMQLTDVLEYLHGRGILHMDIKPANIMLTKEGNICLIDFNISLAEEGDALNGISEVYASPEQYRKWWGILYGTADKDIRLDAATDIYSLGATFYHMMTGNFPSPDIQRMVPIRQYALPYSDALTALVDKMLQADKRKRYQSAARVNQAIRQLQRTKAEKNTLKGVFGLMLAAVLVLVVVFGVVLFRNSAYVGRKELANIQNMEQQLAAWCNSGEYELAYREGIAFLNIEGVNLYKVEGAGQSILEKLVEACIGMEDYETASFYLNELLSMEEKAVYYQNQAIIAAHEGNFAAAEAALLQAEYAGGKEQELTRTRAEMKVAQGLYGEALKLYQQIAGENAESAMLRRMAALALYAAEASPQNAEKSAYIANAVTYYEKLFNSGMASYSDRMNMVTAYVMGGMHEKAISVLQGMQVNYPDRYEIYLQLSILKYNAELKKAPAARDFTKTKEYAGMAEKLYKESGQIQRDEQLQNMLDIVDGL